MHPNEIKVIRRQAAGHSVLIEAEELGEKWPHRANCWVYEGRVYQQRFSALSPYDWGPDRRSFAPSMVVFGEDDQAVAFDDLGTVEDLEAALPEPPPPPPPWQVAGGRELDPARRTLLAAGCQLVSVDGRWVVLMPSDVGTMRSYVIGAAALIHEAGTAIGHLELDEDWGDRILLAPGLVVRPEIADMESMAVGRIES